MKTKWVCSEGGPLILLPQSQLKQWQGVTLDGADVLDPTTDYGRACAIDDCLGIVKVGKADGLVLGDVPNATAWMPLDEENGGLLIRWVWAENEASVLQSARHVPDTAFAPDTLEFQVDESALWLFDSALAGSHVDAKDALFISLAAGRYMIETAEYRPNPQTNLLIHRLSLR